MSSLLYAFFEPQCRGLSKQVDLLCDVRAVVRYLLTGSVTPKVGHYTYVKDFEVACQRVDALKSKVKGLIPCSMDLETLGLDPYRKPTLAHPGAYIVSIQVSVEVGKSHVVKFHSPQEMRQWINEPGHRTQLEYLLNDPRISMRGANFKYDLNWIYEHFKIECTNFRLDTTIVGSLLDENRSNGLDVHAKVFTDMGGYSDTFDRTVDKSRMDIALNNDPEGFLTYAGGDTDACLCVSEVQKNLLLQDEHLSAFYVNVMHPAARAFELVERGGVYVSKEAYKELESDLNNEIDTLLAKAKPILGGRLVAKHRDLTKRGHLNLQKASLLIDFMFSPSGLNLKPRMFTEGSEGKSDGDKVPSTSMEHLMMFHDVPEAKEFVDLLKDYGSATKTLNTYVTGFLVHLRDDGRFHPAYWLFTGNRDEGEGGARTGRLSVKEPAFQTIPKHTKWAKKLRRCFPAPPGMLMLENDYSQGELRVIACIAMEETMLQAYANGMDLHVLTGGRIAGLEYEEMMALSKGTPEEIEKYEALRQLAKARRKEVAA